MCALLVLPPPPPPPSPKPRATCEDDAEPRNDPRRLAGTLRDAPSSSPVFEVRLELDRPPNSENRLRLVAGAAASPAPTPTKLPALEGDAEGGLLVPGVLPALPGRESYPYPAYDGEEGAELQSNPFIVRTLPGVPASHANEEAEALESQRFLLYA